MTALLVAVCTSLGIAAAGLLLAWGRAERRAEVAERELQRRDARAERQRLTEAALTQHFATTPREQPTQLLPPADPDATRPLRLVTPYYIARKDHNQR
jgi:hypothetical protein